MKHLKLFENINSDIDNEKYIVISTDRHDIPFYILRIYDEDQDFLYYNQYTYCNYNEDSKVRISNNNGKIPNSNMFPILYQTNNYEEAKNYFILLLNTEKYNL